MMRREKTALVLRRPRLTWCWMRPRQDLVRSKTLKGWQERSESRSMMMASQAVAAREHLHRSQCQGGCPEKGHLG